MESRPSMVKDAMKKIVMYADLISSSFLLRMGFESNSLIVLYFHSVFRDEREKKNASVVTMSYDGITLDDLGNMIKYFIAAGYKFTSPQEILAGTAGNKKYIMLTFDDGYANNMMTLYTLREFDVPAVFFISVGHILSKKCFWWDVVYRELLKRAHSFKDIGMEIQRLKRYRAEDIDEYITSNFGSNAFAPVGDLDRPFTVKELKEFSQQPHVCIGNHTMDHAILTNYNKSAIKSQISMAQDALQDITHYDLPIISYPSGAYSSEVIKICDEMNFSMGFTIEPEKISLPISTSDHNHLLLSRFSLRGNDTVLHQCGITRSDFLLSRSLRRIYRYFQSKSIVA